MCKFAKQRARLKQINVSAIRNFKFCVLVVWVTNWFDLGTIQWFPLKNSRFWKPFERPGKRLFQILLRFRFLKISWNVLSSVYLFKVSNGNIRIMCQICSKLTMKNGIKTSFWCLHWCLWTYSTYCSGVSIVDFKGNHVNTLITNIRLLQHKQQTLKFLRS